MSDTDDTDLLLLIPPDFFVIQSSDSEDDFKKTDFSREKNEIERAVVNDLVTQVNELESRICAIESSDSSSLLCNGFCNQSLDSLSVKNSKFVNEDCFFRVSQMPVNSQLAGSLDNVCHSNSYPNDRVINYRHQFSLPSTPKTLPFNQRSLSARAIRSNPLDQKYKASNLYYFSYPSLANHELSCITDQKKEDIHCKNLRQSDIINNESYVNKTGFKERENCTLL